MRKNHVPEVLQGTLLKLGTFFSPSLYCTFFFVRRKSHVPEVLQGTLLKLGTFFASLYCTVFRALLVQKYNY